ncbi:hypothetical protein X755_15940 [Mesorhizobium sp. LNJC405B00]|nr:hypothetical protein X755_15940 [Mesorhizobium sp. LNJC405B00]
MMAMREGQAACWSADLSVRAGTSNARAVIRADRGGKIGNAGQDIGEPAFGSMS